jgi:hypothetical protein
MKPAALILLLPMMANAAESRKPDQTFWRLVAGSAAVSAVDLVTSVQAQHRGAYEQNPMLPRHPSAARFAVQSGIESLVWYYAAYRVNRHHKTIARIMLGGDIVSESVGNYILEFLGGEND